jgi:type IV pilus assembly protein PilW
VPKKVEGFTLVELMVALALGLVILTGILSIFSETRKSFRVNENLGRVQENARFASELLAREIRESGSTPCGNRAIANVIRSGGATPWYADWAAGTVRGFDNTEDSPSQVAFGVATGNRVSGTDAIILLRNVSDESSIRVVTAHNLAGIAFTVQPDPTTSYGVGDLITTCDAKSGALLQISTVSSSPSQVEYGGVTLNCSVNLGYPTGACGSPPVKTFDPGSLVTKFDPVFWYVGINPKGKRSLYRMKVLATTAAGVTTTNQQADEMIPNIQDIQIEYLYRDTALSNALATSWVSASNAFFNAANGGWSESNTKQVVATKITITLLSDEKVGSTGQALQRQFISVSSLRSRDIP